MCVCVDINIRISTAYVHIIENKHMYDMNLYIYNNIYSILCYSIADKHIFTLHVFLVRVLLGPRCGRCRAHLQ